ncbi:nose resistant to fluoxetine protein 6-like [Episyrphus balteatus]|uniref:nose resistant to fluoxetine protein 6-like n=1 Tax=Episyrphus balteatus TaxID=286459 RepID=UPI002485EBCF|nr:nose resistant to fluoxetine protein 6-like [Episyrphus balteatus]
MSLSLHRRNTPLTKCVITFLFLALSLQQFVKVKGDGAADLGVTGGILPLELDQLQVVNFLVGISADGILLSNGSDSQCGKDLEVFLKGVEEQDPWALKVIDSFGVAPQTITWGNYFWFAAKEYCEDLNRPYKISLSGRYRHKSHFNTSSPFPVRFWMVYFNFTTPVYVDLNLQFEHKIHAGLCMPKSCTHDEVLYFSESYFAKKKFEPQQRFNIDMNVIDAKDPKFEWKVLLTTGFLLYFGVLSSLIFCMIIAEIITQIHKRRALNEDEKSPKPEITRLEEFFLCFNLRDNYKRMLQLEGSKGFLPVIAGLRSVVCLWVTLFHVYFYSLFAISNVPLIFAKLETIVLQPVLQSCFYVDVFFVISSFLLSYNFLSNTKSIESIRKNSFGGNAKFFFKSVLHRYVRLLPIMVVTMILSDCIYDFMDMFSPFQMDQYNGLYCKQNWWYNILFINNFLDLKDICSSWTWYLGCEMQFFILFTLILIIYAKHEPLGKSIFVILLIFSLVVSFLCNYFMGITFQIDVIFGTLEQLYVKPWVRVNSYFAGVLMGWIYFHYKDEGINLKMSKKIIFWTITFFIYLFTNFMSFWRSAPVWLVASIMSFGKFIFGLCVGCVIVMCQWGFGGPFNALMSSRPCLFLNKFCFCIYMIAPVVVVVVFASRTQATHFSEVGSSMDFMGVIVISILMSLIVVLLVEIPFQKISSKFIVRRKTK